MTFDELAAKWKYESDLAQMKAIDNGAPHNVVTREYMRYCVLQWLLEIEETRK
jgi:hypothetical protein